MIQELWLPHLWKVALQTFLLPRLLPMLGLISIHPGIPVENVIHLIDCPTTCDLMGGDVVYVCNVITLCYAIQSSVSCFVLLSWSCWRNKWYHFESVRYTNDQRVLGLNLSGNNFFFFSTSLIIHSIYTYGVNMYSSGQKKVAVP
jgi:hypothetical protein